MPTVFYTGGKTDWEMVPVIKASARGEQFVADIGQGVVLIWTPAVDRGKTLGIPALEGAPKLPSIWVYPPTEQARQILVNPVYPPEYQDAIIWFPADAGVEPIYVMLSLRDRSGVVSGIGEDVTEDWLQTARSGLGAPIPTRLANQLRGRSYSSFGAFRRAFWIAVSRDTELGRQFSSRDLARLKAGKAPRVDISDIAGARISHEIHHVELISKGGDVYNVDNLRVNTPKNHIEVHQD